MNKHEIEYIYNFYIHFELFFSLFRTVERAGRRDDKSQMEKGCSLAVKERCEMSIILENRKV